MTARAPTETRPERLLVLLLDERPSASEVRLALRQRSRPGSIQVVAPAHVDLLHWYSTDESDAWAEAAERARRAAAVAPGTAEVRADAGEADPVLAVQDALQEFPADEVVIVGDDGGNGALEPALRRLGVRVTRLGEAPDGGGRVRETGRAIMSGRSDATPYVIFAGVALAMAAVVVAILAIGLLVMWLA